MDLALRRLLASCRNNAEVARRLGVTREWVRQLREKAQLPPVRQARRDAIARMLREGKAPREIARTLGVRSVRATIDLMRRRGLLDEETEEEGA